MSRKVFDLFPTSVYKVNLLDDISSEFTLKDLTDLSDWVTSDPVPSNPVLDICEGDVKTCYIEDWQFASYVLHDVPEFCDLILAYVSQYAHLLGIEYCIIADSWYTRMNKGARVLRHRHENSVISGTLYLNAPKGNKGLAFVNPTIPHRMKDKTNTSTKYNEQVSLVEVTTGDLLLYPSWLEHFVPPIECDNRVTISFNCDYKRLA
tara:strand:- start:368 stop:985 length:618 start_codon:yes stop_codon:yes gene_type:complete